MEAVQRRIDLHFSAVAGWAKIVAYPKSPADRISGSSKNKNMISQTWRGGFGHAFSAGAGTRSAFRTTAVFALLSCAAAFLPTARLAAATATVDLSLSGSTWQTLRGFGGASVYLGALTDAEMDLLFKSASGTIGLTVDRVRISP